MSRLAALSLNLHERQGTALLTKATEVLYGGAAGGGKSHLMRVAAILWCGAVPGLQVYLFRRIEGDLVKNHVEGPKGFRALLAPWTLTGFATIVEEEIRFWNGSKIYLCHCKDEKDRFKYQGAEIHVLMIDELTHFSDVIYRFLRARVRAVGLAVAEAWRGMFPRILCGSNPGNIGHHWVKAAFINSALPFDAWRTPDAEGGMVRQFIPAKLEDNPSMTEDDPTYRLRLRGLGSPELVKAMEDGDWNVIVGAYFPEFSMARHVLDPRKVGALPEHWMRFRAMDWGSAKPFSVGWYAVSDGELPGIPKGCLVKWREWYGSNGTPNVGLKLTAEEVAAGILQREAFDPKDQYGRTVAYGEMDPAAFAQDGGPSIAERMHRAGVDFRPADNKRTATTGHMGGWDQVRARLKGDSDGPQILFFSTCRDTIRTLPALQHDENRPEDVDTEGEDHAGDETRYACMSRPYIQAAPVIQKPRSIVIGGESTATMNDLWAKQPKRDNRI